MFFLSDLSNYARGIGDKDKKKRKRRNNLIRNAAIGLGAVGLTAGLGYLTLKGKGKPTIAKPTNNFVNTTTTSKPVISKKQEEIKAEIKKINELKDRINNPNQILSNNNLSEELSKPNPNVETIGKKEFNKQLQEGRKKYSYLKAKPIKPDNVVVSGTIGGDYKQVTYEDLKNLKKLEESVGNTEQSTKWLKEIKKHRSKKIQTRVAALQQGGRRRLAEKYGSQKANEIINNPLSNDLYSNIGIKPQRGYSSVTNKARRKAKAKIAKLIARREVIDTNGYYSRNNKLITFKR